MKPPITKNKEIKQILYLLQQAGVLMQMLRSHKKHLGNSYDTIASHSHNVAIIAYCLCRMEGLTHEDGLKASGMAIFHDLPEARTGDHDLVSKYYNRVNQEKALNDQFKGIKFSKDIKELITEYKKKDSAVSKCAKDADWVSQMYTQWLLSWQGNKLSKKWLDSDFNDRYPNFFTNSARRLIDEMMKSNPHEWWWSQFLPNGANLEHFSNK